MKNNKNIPMKTLFTLILLTATLSINAQDSTRLRIKPIVANLEGDSIVAIDFDHWRNADTNSTMTLLVRYYDQHGKVVHTENMVVPARIANRYIRSRSIIDDFILTRKQRLRKQ